MIKINLKIMEIYHKELHLIFQLDNLNLKQYILLQIRNIFNSLIMIQLSFRKNLLTYKNMIDKEIF